MDDLIEGRNAVIEALRARLPIVRVLVAQNLSGDAISEIERLARETATPVVRVQRRELDRHSVRGAHQGVAAELRAFTYAKLAEVVSAHRTDAMSLIVVLDHVTDPQNLGAISRSAEVAGACALVVSERRSAAVGAAAFKASAGALAHLPVVRTVNIARTLEELKEAEYWIAGASERADQLLWDAPLEGRIALVLGAEGAGLSRLVSETCDFLVGIPVRGRTESLNVANAASVLIYEWIRRQEAGA